MIIIIIYTITSVAYNNKKKSFQISNISFFQLLPPVPVWFPSMTSEGSTRWCTPRGRSC